MSATAAGKPATSAVLSKPLMRCGPEHNISHLGLTSITLRKYSSCQNRTVT